MLKGHECFRFNEEIQNAYERLQHPIAIFQFIDKHIIPIVFSDGFCQLFGYENQEQAYNDEKQDPFEIIHPDDVLVVRNEIHRFIAGEPTIELFYRSRIESESGYRLIHAAGKHVYMENDVHLAHIWYTDESTDANKRIVELQESVSALLTNMPAMTFSKDVITRKYIACNQSFAEYAHKETPEGVVGLTDFDIFDSATAEHFIEDDKKALSMDKPYIFFEDVPDAAGNPRRFQTTKLKFVDTNGRLCLLGLCQDVTDAMLIKQEYDEMLAYAHDQAHIDSLTGIRNKNAYNELEEKMNRQITENTQPEFSITIFDVNDLKKINDTLGHKAGDEYICKACKIICERFKHSPVFRIGGDEFVVISEGEDYENIEEVMKYFAEYNENAQKEDGIIIACGMAKYDDDNSVEEVFMQADKRMYNNKNLLKKG